MSVWAWIGIGLGAAVGMSVLLGIVVARVLGSIAAEASRLLESEVWLVGPLSRQAEEAVASTISAAR
jgi:hypothetical protein